MEEMIKRPKPEWSGIFRALRRIFYYKFRKEYIKKSLAKRKGKCKKCGCCSTKMIPCQHFNIKTGECMLWKELSYDEIPYHCQAYPFDEKDKTDFSKLNCGFYWDEE